MLRDGTCGRGHRRGPPLPPRTVPGAERFTIPPCTGEPRARGADRIACSPQRPDGGSRRCQPATLPDTYTAVSPKTTSRQRRQRSLGRRLSGLREGGTRCGEAAGTGCGPHRCLHRERRPWERAASSRRGAGLSQEQAVPAGNGGPGSAFRTEECPPRHRNQAARGGFSLWERRPFLRATVLSHADFKCLHIFF